jgi:hypothetical protein
MGKRRERAVVPCGPGDRTTTAAGGRRVTTEPVAAARASTCGRVVGCAAIARATSGRRRNSKTAGCAGGGAGTSRGGAGAGGYAGRTIKARRGSGVGGVYTDAGGTGVMAGRRRLAARIADCVATGRYSS